MIATMTARRTFWSKKGSALRVRRGAELRDEAELRE
jgi:hypothetical protein